jgi:ankyrin repeat protein
VDMALGQSPLMWAVQMCKEETVRAIVKSSMSSKRMLETKSRVSFGFEAGLMPIGGPASRSAVAPLFLLLSPPPPFFFPSPTPLLQFGTTALMMAVEANSGMRKPGIIRELLEGGANPDTKDSKGRTALSIANAKGLKDIVAILEQGLSAEEEESTSKKSPSKSGAKGAASKKK